MKLEIKETIPFCFTCEHYLGGYSCEAFKKIPEEIIINKVKHSNIYQGQSGMFTYAPQPEIIEETVNYKEWKKAKGIN